MPADAAPGNPSPDRGPKTCTKCGEVKPLEAFGPHPRGRDGKRGNCRVCHAADDRARREADPERARAYWRRWNEANREKTRAQSRAWYAANREKAAASHRARREANPGKAAAATRAWQAANPDKARALKDIRRARKRNAPVVERIYRARVWDRDGGRCHICGKKADPNNWHLEHLIPLALGGEHSYRNVAVSHPTCNLRKGVTGPAQLLLGVDDHRDARARQTQGGRP